MPRLLTRMVFRVMILHGVSLWQAGFKNVIVLCGANDWTGDHEALLRQYQMREIYLCLDNDEDGAKATEQQPS